MEYRRAIKDTDISHIFYLLSIYYQNSFSRMTRYAINTYNTLNNIEDIRLRKRYQSLVKKFLMIAADGEYMPTERLLGEEFYNGKLGFGINKPLWIDFLSSASNKGDRNAKQLLQEINNV
ncbi:2495_t:CDS:1 [Scutellospora calospora]|uniref:2495_t:CDS:1 n=1 Tax=Scutellospora calospora TaxID=85575 RepID=A0ACA9LMQ6_9GLOM|nr:2495_t:CDS:1 [Scutellospora calospora]